MRCDHCQNQLLDYLYGLLDAMESEALECHLASCPECLAARDRARQEQSLFSSAAKATFPDFRFCPPVSELPGVVTSESQPGSFSCPISVKPSLRRQSWSAVSRLTSWAVAASLIIAIPSVFLFVRQQASQTQLALAELTQAQAERDALEQRLVRETQQHAQQHQVDNATLPTSSPSQIRENAQRERTEKQTEPVMNPSGITTNQLAAKTVKSLSESLRAEFFEQQKALARDAKNKALNVDVIGPSTIQPGAPNEYTVVVHDQQETKGLKQIEAMVRDQNNRVLFRQLLDTEKKGERHQIRLPASLWTDLANDTDLYLVVATIDPKTRIRSEAEDKVRLLGPVYTTFLTTDKPLYRPGERVFFRSLTLDRTSFRPPDREQELHFELRDSHGKPIPGLAITGTTNLVREVGPGKTSPVFGPDNQPVRGIACGSFDLPADLPPGDYTLHVSEIRHPAGYVPTSPASRKITVRPYTTDQFQKKLEFTGASFQAGQEVGAWCEVLNLGRPVAGALVTTQIIVDDQTMSLPPVETGPDGRALLRFTLPAVIEVGHAQLLAEVRVGPVTERISRPIPVIGRRLNVEFFPEGGYLVAGVPCRVYLRATTPTGQPVDLRGSITDGRRMLARVETFTDPLHPGANRGLGSFTFTPEIGTIYWLKVDEPKGVNAPLRIGPVPTVPSAVVGSAAVAASRTGYLLPPVKNDGVVMSVDQAVSRPGQPIIVQLWSVGRPRQLVVGAYTRGRILDTRSVVVTPGQPAIVHLGANGNQRGGVTRVTVFEQPPPQAANRDLIPVAERLVYRIPSEELKLTYRIQLAHSSESSPQVQSNVPSPPGADADGRPPLQNKQATVSYLPANEPAELHIRATDESGQPTPALLYAAVVDANSLAMSESRRERSLSTHFLLAGEVQKPDDLEYVDFLLTDSPLATHALDLLLGTQGWRRFAEQAGGQIHRKHRIANPDLDGLVMANGMAPVEVPTMYDLKVQQTYADFITKYQETLEATSRQVTDIPQLATQTPHLPASSTPAMSQEVVRLQDSYQAKQREYESRRADALTRFEFLQLAKQWAGVAVGLSLFASLAFFFMTIRWAEGAVRLPLALATGAAFCLTGLLAYFAWTPADPQTVAILHQSPAREPHSEPAQALDSNRVMPVDTSQHDVKTNDGVNGQNSDRPVLPSQGGSADTSKLMTDNMPFSTPSDHRHESDVPKGLSQQSNADQARKETMPLIQSPQHLPKANGSTDASGAHSDGSPQLSANVAQRPSTSNSKQDFLADRQNLTNQSLVTVKSGPPQLSGGAAGSAISPSPSPGAIAATTVGRQSQIDTSKGLDSGTATGNLPASPRVKLPENPSVASASFGHAGQPGKAGQGIITPESADNYQMLPSQSMDRMISGHAANAEQTLGRSAELLSSLRERARRMAEPRVALPEKSSESEITPSRDLNELLNLRKMIEQSPFKREQTEMDANSRDPIADSNSSVRRWRQTDPGDIKHSLDSLLQLPPFVVREYAPMVTTPQPEIVSLDTILWHPLIVVPNNGAVKLPLQAFAYSAGYDIIIAGHTLNGRIGAIRGTVPVLPTSTR